MSIEATRAWAEGWAAGRSAASPAIEREARDSLRDALARCARLELNACRREAERLAARGDAERTLRWAMQFYADHGDMAAGAMRHPVRLLALSRGRDPDAAESAAAAVARQSARSSLAEVRQAIAGQPSAQDAAGWLAGCDADAEEWAARLYTQVDGIA